MWMSAPNIFIDTPVYQINLTLLLSVITICLTALATLVRIFGKKPNPEELPGNNLHCRQHKIDLDKVEVTTKENSKKYDELKQIANDLSKEVGILKNQNENVVKSMDEMKETNKEIASRLDDLLKQLIEWIS